MTASVIDPRWTTLLDEARRAHDLLPELQAFCPFPDPLTPQEVTPHHIPAADLMMQDKGLFSDVFPAYRDALVNAGPIAQWRETYKGAPISQAFLDRFACYEILGVDAPFATTEMRSFVVYQPPGLYYPWHHHPAEELYVVIAGEAEFSIEGEDPRTLRSGDTIFHRSNVPHALTTHEHPVMACVLWRGDLKTKPVLTYPDNGS